MACVTESAATQCDLSWGGGEAIAGVNDLPAVLHPWDPDGAGPAPWQLVVGGYFTRAGGVAANHVASWDPVTGVWSRFGSGTNLEVLAAATDLQGNLLLGGRNGLQRWNGTTLIPLLSGSNGGLNGTVRGIAVRPNGDIVVTGTFTAAGLTNVSRVARWNGSQWLPLGSGLDAPGEGIVALPNGDVLVVGEFTTAGGVPASRIARWDGSNWFALGAGLTGSVAAGSIQTARHIVRQPNGDIVVGGNFGFAGGQPATAVARWDGASWWPLGAGFATQPQWLSLTAGGDVMAVAAMGSPCVVWDGSAWQAATSGLPGLSGASTMPNGDVIGVGTFSSPGERIARWNGVAWEPLPTASNPWIPAPNWSVTAVAATAAGHLVAAGQFSSAGGVPLGGIGRYDGSAWHSLGTLSSPWAYSVVNDLVTMPNGDLIVAGWLSAAGSVPVNNVARWDGTTWSALSGGTTGSVVCLAAMPNGDLVIGGSFTNVGGVQASGVARWNGTTWSAFGSGPPGGVGSMVVTPAGQLVVAGAFGVANWNGSTWTTMPTGNPFAVEVVRCLADGSIVAAGGIGPPLPFQADGAIGRWNGSAWVVLGHVIGHVQAMQPLPDGGLLATGSFHILNTGVTNFARWTGTAWVSVPGTQEAGQDFTWLPDGSLVVGGTFQTFGGNYTPYLARLSATCPAQSQPAGAGCPGSGGANLLTTTALPWLGSAFRASGTGLPTTCFVSQVYGFQPFALPLAAILPMAPPGCDLLVSPDFVDFAICTTGSVSTALSIPASPALVGAGFRHQLNLFEVNASLDIVEVTASNALSLTIGVF